LVVITNDAWFGDEAAPYQHFSQAVLRAVENRRTLIRAANTGISGIILPTGRVESRLGMFKRGVLLGRTPVYFEKTIYTVMGDVLPQFCLGVTVLVFLAAFLRRNRYAGRSEAND
jgi:apolipoprotein N-acyltransferase